MSKHKMSQSGLCVDEVLSPEIFPEEEIMVHANIRPNVDECEMYFVSSSSMSSNEPEPTDDIPDWKGMSMDEIRKGFGQFDFQELPALSAASHHTVLFMLPIPARGLPKAYPPHNVDKWTQGCVRMPHSKYCLYPVNEQSANRECRNRWEAIQNSLLQSFISSHQLEAAIMSYNHVYSRRWDFAALHHFFSEIVEEEESKMFFDVLLPKMIHLALQLPTLITGPIPLLKRNTNGCISLSQLQVASLLANAFFCTFPRRNSTSPQSEYATYPHINFNGLFSAFREERQSRIPSVMEKLKCIFHYFRRVTTTAPEGIITIQRQYIPKNNCPKWDSLDEKMPPLHITSKGTIEADGAGLLQVDFANKYLGGAVLGFGCVQEEIRFVICPELLVTLLVTEVLDDTESLIVSGVERYSNYEGYSNNFKWTGDYIDNTPWDSSKRRMTTVVAIDALRFKNPLFQFNTANITRELNKAYVGFSRSDVYKENLPAVATGNWGCGAFHGNPKLKALLQLMAASIAGRSVVYFTFGDIQLRDDIAAMYWHIVQHNITIGHLFRLILAYQETPLTKLSDFYHFLYNKSKMKQPCNYFTTKNGNQHFMTTTVPLDKVHLRGEDSMLNSDKTLAPSCKSTSNDHHSYDGVIEGTSSGRKEENRSALSEEHNSSHDKPEIVKNVNKEIATTTRQTEYCDVEQYETIIDDDVIIIEPAREKKKIWKTHENKGTNKTLFERRLSGFDLLDKREMHLTSDNSSINDLSTIVRVSTNLANCSTSNDNSDIRDVHSPATVKVNPIRSSQKKISEFFQKPL